jgi:electron transfer flavoprotein alpha/beta subunit
VLVVVEPSAVATPHPYVVDGRLLEAHRTWAEADRSALEAALRLRDAASGPLTITVASVGPPGAAQVLREALSVGADRVLLVATGVGVGKTAPTAVAPDSAASALAAVLNTETPFDLVLGSARGKGDEGQLARLTAAALGVPFAGNAVALAVQTGPGRGSALLLGADRRQRERALPALVGVEAGAALRPFITAGYLASLHRGVEVHPWPSGVEAAWVVFREQASAADTPPTQKQPEAIRPQEAGRWILKELGRANRGAAPAEDSDVPIEDVDRPQFSRPDARAPSVLAILATDAAGFVRPSAEPVVGAARLAAKVGGRGLGLAVALVVPAREEVQRRALAQLLSWYQGDVILVALRGGETSDEVKARLLAESLGRLESIPLAVVGEGWTEAAFAHLRNHPGGGDPLVSGVRFLAGEDNRLMLETDRARGRLLVRQTRTLGPGRTCWIVLADDAEVKLVSGGVVSGEGSPEGSSAGPLRWSGFTTAATFSNCSRS